MPAVPGFEASDAEPDDVDAPGRDVPELPVDELLVELVDGLAEDVVEELVEAGDGEDPACFASTFSAVRSIVTGRLDAPVVADGLSGLPEDPLPPEEDVPPEDFLSVAICSPPEPCKLQVFQCQDLHYTHLFAKRYRCGEDFSAPQ